MIASEAFLLVAQFAVLAAVVLGLFRFRETIGLTPLYVMLGVFQPLQALLAATLYIEILPGLVASPGNFMFALTLVVLFLVYIREDALEARRFIYCILGANLLMTAIFAASGVHLGDPATINVLDIPPQLFNLGARVTGVGTLVLVADVLLMIATHAAVRRIWPNAVLLRAWLTLTIVMVFDGVAFTLGAFHGSADLPSLLSSAIAVKAMIGTLAAALAVAYLRFAERPGSTHALPDLALGDIFYSLSYRDRFELQASRTAEVEAELGSVFQRIGDAVVAIGPDGRYTFANDLACRFIGLPREQVIGSDADELTRDAAPRLLGAVDMAMRTQQPQVVDEYFEPQDRHFESRIYPSPEGVTIYFNDVTERNRQRDELERQARTDTLTGLPNRRAFSDAVDALVDDASGSGIVGLVAINLDRLRHVNNTMGYDVGDEVLRQAAARLRAATRPVFDLVARIGGDEFAVAGATIGVGALTTLADGLVAAFRTPFPIGDESVNLACSAGVVWVPDAGRDAGALLRSADLTLNVAKQRGGDQAVRFSAERANLLRQRMRMTSELRAAAETSQVDLVFQPIIESTSGKIVAAEALMRWESPQLGVVNPAEFISVAEDTGLIVDLGFLAIRRALLYVEGWRAGGYAPVPVAVNVSPVQFRHARFVADVVRALEGSGSAPSGLKLEITESAFIDDVDGAVETLARLKEMGVRISLDDFGTGYSSLALLRQLPLDEVKIDRSFVEQATASGPAAILCRNVVSMSHELGLSVVAEGVETEAQAAFLKGIGCDQLQGFLYSRPLASHEFAERFLA